jgi:hypothetical protein
VPIYRLYYLKRNRLSGWEDVQAEHDLAAIDLARHCRGNGTVELWAGKRKITTFEQHPEMSEVQLQDLH